MAQKRLEEIRKIRLEKLEKLRKLGIDPFPSKSKKDHSNKQILENYKKFEGKRITLTGRLMSWREHGKIVFSNIQDESGSIQLFIKKDALKDTNSKKQTLGFSDLTLLDVGDFVQATGEVTKTTSGEVSLMPSEIKILVKSIRPLPSTWHGLKDIEERYRKRYLDIILNSDVKKRLIERSLVISTMREFLNGEGFLEVETPTLQPIYGGGFARPFVTHHNALDADFYLRISDEMYLKRLIVGGFEKVYEITKVFRNEGIDRDHNPEFTMFEAQIAFEDYTYGMDLFEKIIERVAISVSGSTKVQFMDREIDFKRPWQRFKLTEAVKKFAGINPLSWKTLEEAKKQASKTIKDTKKNEELERMQKIGEIMAFVFEEIVEEKLIQPTIIYDYPIEVSPLAKKCKDPRFTQRFEVFVSGMEIGNNYTELNDPVDLNDRFIEEEKREEAGFKEAHQTDIDYLEAIEHGFPPTCGLGIGIDRLAMIMTNAKTIKEIIAFPTLRPKTKKKKAKK